jgi:transducin (beta)-like 1
MSLTLTCYLQHDGSLLASGTYNGKTRIWGTDGEMKHVFQYHNGPVFATRWSKSGHYLLSASFDKTVVVWDAKLQTKKQQIKLHDGAATLVMVVVVSLVRI